MTTQVIHAEATKPAKKAAVKAVAAKPAVKKAAAKKPAVKAAPKAKAPKGIKCMVANRPGSGVLLFAYTEAALQLLGMYDGAEVEKATLAKVMGQTAISYHTAKATLVRLDNGRYALTKAGKAFFAERACKAIAADLKGWTKVLSTGKADGVVVKNPDMLTAI